VTPAAADAYARAAAALLGLDIPPERREAVVAHILRLAALADDVLEFAAPDAPASGTSPPSSP